MLTESLLQQQIHVPNAASTELCSILAMFVVPLSLVNYRIEGEKESCIILPLISVWCSKTIW